MNFSGHVDKEKEGSPLIDRGTVDVLERRAFHGTTLSTQRGLDPGNQIRSTKGRRHVRVPSLDPSAHEYISLPRGRR